jgi:RES domain-containing protein
MSKGYRWNSFSTRLVYTSESRALATLEVYVHVDLSEDLPTDRFYVEIEIPDETAIQEVKIEDLPEGWNSNPPDRITQSIGDDFILQGETAVLKVPSSIVPQEYNILINPHHPDTRSIKVISKTSMSFDQRLKNQMTIGNHT